MTVDGAGTTGDPSPGHHHGLGRVGGLTHELPVMVTGHDVGATGETVFHFFGQVLEIRVIRTGLDEQNRF
ncbi:MAG TPA: hypothetical protein EYO85_04700 [Rhodospirillales bacterium]|nr:hypothetical protein [Rhodospirillales bacterium]